jgi:hypothetical protein
MIDKKITLERANFVKGLRAGNISVKIYKSKDNRYVVVRRRYFLGVLIHKKYCLVDDYESAEDIIRELKFDGKCRKLG